MATPDILEELQALPTLLNELEFDVSRSMRKAAIERLARLVDAVTGVRRSSLSACTSTRALLYALTTRCAQPAAVHLGTFMRGDWDGDGAMGDGIDLVVALLHDEDPMVVQHALLVIGNLCSRKVDPNADETKVLLRGKKVAETLIPLICDERAGALTARRRPPSPS